MNSIFNGSFLSESTKRYRQILKLSKRDLKRAILIAMEYQECKADDGKGTVYKKNGASHLFSSFPDWERNIEAIYVLEDSIPYYEKKYYIDALLWVLDETGMFNLNPANKDYQEMWCVLHASASQRARAWLIWFIDKKLFRPKVSKNGNE